jgi:flagellar biosynthesis protein FlhA
MPFLPFTVLAAGLLAISMVLRQNSAALGAQAAVADIPVAPPEARMGDLLDLDDIHVEFAPDLVGMVLDPATGLDSRIERMRSHIATTYGLVLPEIRITDNPELPPNQYAIRIHGVPQASDTLFPELLLALEGGAGGALPEGRPVREPVYGAPARWIDPRDRERAVLGGLTIVLPPEVLATHLLEVVKRNFSRLLTLKALRRLFREMTSMSDAARSEANRKLLDELVPDKVPQELLLTILRLLLDERVSIRNLPLILEAIAEARGIYSVPESICEHVRQRLGFQIVGGLRRPDGTVPLIQLAPAWEEIFAAHQIEGAGRTKDVALPPRLFRELTQALARESARLAEQGTYPALVTTAIRRRFLSGLSVAGGLSLPVISFEELGLDARPAIVGEVEGP